MTNDDEKIIEDVKFILNSGDEGLIHTLKVTIPAYLQCIAVNRRRAELEAERELLLKKQQELLEKKKELMVLKKKSVLLQKKINDKVKH
jgi:hypothetical protein